MKKFITTLMLFAMVSTSSGMVAGDTLEEGWKEGTEATWKTGAGAHDGASTAISAAMIGCGVALVLGIAILAATLHQSTSGAHSHCDSN